MEECASLAEALLFFIVNYLMAHFFNFLCESSGYVDQYWDTLDISLPVLESSMPNMKG